MTSMALLKYRLRRGVSAEDAGDRAGGAGAADWGKMDSGSTTGSSPVREADGPARRVAGPFSRVVSIGHFVYILCGDALNRYRVGRSGDSIA